ncbi:PucR family transcriptional regulator [Gordonia desulfuricans]|uniref:PucR family transcriptional regulator n=1 Tax=Gordonia desulfuricans TaxID=89051 RepID=A0A7K3LS33_9ACTN|nr:PucR family transcriptional regulator [Gordonia desulfuricans]NDK91094.1 PucR family transcriptional regulator [Gordonia desulfuricans]
MTITVRDVLGLPELQRGDPVVLSDRRLDDVIRWVHVGDVPDLSGLLTGGELILTTGASLANWPQRYLQGLSSSGAVGVVVELGASVPTLPGAVTRLARDADLALIVLRRSVRFVDVTEAVHRRLVAEQYEAVAFDRLVHETFTELSMNRASVVEVVAAAARMLDEPVVLEDLSHQVLTSSIAPHADTAITLDDWERRSRRNTDGRAGTEPWVWSTVGPRGEAWGRVIVPRNPIQRDRTVRVLERAGVALALNRMIERDRTSLHQRAQSGLIDDVVDRRVTTESEIAARAHALGLARARRYWPVVIRVDSTTPDGDPLAAQRRSAQLLDAVSHTVRSGGHTGLFTVRPPGDIHAVVALRPARGQDPESTLTSLADHLHEAVARTAGDTRCTVAVGEPDGGLVPAIRALADAAHVAEVAGAMSGRRRPFYRASDTRLRGLVAVLKDDPRVQAFAESELRRILTEAPEHLELLRNHVQLNGNKAAVAQRMHISRPALYKRLRAVEDILEVDLSDPESLLSLSVATMIYDVGRAARADGERTIGPAAASPPPRSR